MSRLQGQDEGSQKARGDEKASKGDVLPPWEGEGPKTGVERGDEKCHAGLKEVTDKRL